MRLKHLLSNVINRKYALLCAALAVVSFTQAQSLRISGSVLNDGSGLTDGVVDGSTISSVDGAGLWTYLIRVVDSKIIDSSAVSESGAYIVNGVANEKYSLMLSTVSMTHPVSSHLPFYLKIGYSLVNNTALTMKLE